MYTQRRSKLKRDEFRSIDNDFKTIYDNLRAEQEALNAKMQSARGDAIKHVQEVIDAFHLLRSELKFEDDHQAKSPAEKRRGPASIKYRTPNGIEWTGKGNMKREFRDYLLSQGLTPEDKDLFLTPQFMK